MVKDNKSLSEKTSEALDSGVKFDVNFIKKNKFRIIIVFEDLSSKDYFIKFKDPYTFDLGEKRYFIVSKCIIKGKNPTLVYYYNNPCPVLFEFKRSGITALSLYTDMDKYKDLTDKDKITLSQIFIDAEGVYHMTSNTLIKGLYAENNHKLRNILIIVVVIGIIVLLILHFTGVINLGELLGFKK